MQVNVSIASRILKILISALLLFASFVQVISHINTTECLVDTCIASFDKHTFGSPRSVKNIPSIHMILLPHSAHHRSLVGHNINLTLTQYSFMTPTALFLSCVHQYSFMTPTDSFLSCVSIINTHLRLLHPHRLWAYRPYMNNVHNHKHTVSLRRTPKTTTTHL